MNYNYHHGGAINPQPHEGGRRVRGVHLGDGNKKTDDTGLRKIRLHEHANFQKNKPTTAFAHKRSSNIDPPIGFYVILAMLSLAFVFMYLINTSNAENRQKLRRTRTRTRRSVQKKKTDEWSDDITQQETQLLSESVRAGPDNNNHVYHRYHDQQHPRIRKNSSAMGHPAAGGTSYYLNQSGSAVIAQHPSNHSYSSSNLRMPAYNPPDPILAVKKPAQPTPQLSPAPKVFQHSPGGTSTTERTTTTKNVRPLSSSASSFESLTKSESTDPSSDDPLLGNISSPSAIFRQKPPEDSKTLKSPKASYSPDVMVERTPVAGNGRQILHSIDQSVPEEPPAAEDDTDAMLFASPPRKEAGIPFVPSLDVNISSQRPPKSVSLDELQLFQMMESGAVSWEERVAEESRLLKSQAFPSSVQQGQQNQMLLSSSVNESIPSGDPRKSINHKRDDLTHFTDAAASLQGAVDFEELELIDVIGGGGFGQVWKAIWRGTPVAVKVLTGSAQSKSVPRPVLEEFVAECNILRGMRHPNICLYMGTCLKPPNRAIITELAANGSLWDALRLPLIPPYVACDGLTREGWPESLYRPDSRHGVPPASRSGLTVHVPSKGTWHWILVKRVARGAARGMAYLHSGKPPILHRDLKSANILLDESYTAKVCDFGLSRLKAQERSMTGNCGTVQWMAPEVLANQAYNEKADVYSYGIICWELLSRQCPYDKMSPIQCALAVLNRDQRPEIPKWCPPPLQALIRGCLKKDPDQRPTFPEVLKALDAMP